MKSKQFRFVKSILIVALASIYFGEAKADSKFDIQLGLEPLSTGSQFCTLNEATIKGTAAEALKRHGIGVANSGTNPFMFLNVLGTYTAGFAQPHCLLLLDVKILGLTNDDIKKAPFGPIRKTVFRSTLLCNGHAAAITALLNVKQMANTQITKIIDECLSQLEY